MRKEDEVRLIEAGIDAAQVRQRATRGRADQQHDRQRNLDDHEAAGEA